MDCFCDCGCTAPGEPDFCAECYITCVVGTSADPFTRDSTGQALGFLEDDPMGWEF